ncbi:MFS transporter [Alteribacillus iranensis]|uniref:Drug resistance transporter, EmrB/QacA subfamily n=1 Tax=Alteribacillus iranensis TaxID=930128 RepID=A0A1I2CYM5_9BACI|nr:MFS transporter [Alteribacillus iranensis]SFE73359.1 drug resistance transporter, EmrB/QacA subfamily [Alteribacillus iranensis]
MSSIQKPWLLVLTIGLGTLLNPLNSSMIAVAVTRMQNEFALSFADASWLISIFYLFSAAGQPVMGKLSDMFGAKRLFLSGLLIVAAASILAPFSPSFSFLLGCRALQAIGSSTLFPAGMSLVRTYITEKQGRALALLSIFATTSAAFGPSIGGFLIASWDWPSIFLINFPFVILSFTLALFVLPGSKKGKANLKRIDVIGIILFIGTVTGLILFLLSMEEGLNLWALFTFGMGLTLFYIYERKREEPFIDVLSLQSNGNITLIYIQFIIVNLIYYCYFFGLPAYFQQELAYSSDTTGLMMLALAGFSVFTAPLAGHLIDKYGSKLPLLIGSIVLLTGTALLLTYREDSSILWLLIIMAVIGMSSGFTNISTQTALYEHVDRKDTGSASGLFQTSRYLGAILSSSLLGVMFSQHVNTEQLHLIASICLVLCFLLIGLTMRLRGR